MSRVIDVSNKLGEYMLKGWVLTDKPCSTRGCNVPLMRSPSGQTPVVHFCANCDGSKFDQSPSDPIPSSVTTSASSSDISTRTSTPPTEVSGLSSPTFALPPETEQNRLRREQSDNASAEIGRRMLSGWAMLGEDCPNARCYGIPLVRPPNAGGEKSDKRECVICHTVYVSETDWAGRANLVPWVDPATIVKAESLPPAPVVSPLPSKPVERSLPTDYLRVEASKGWDLNPVVKPTSPILAPTRSTIHPTPNPLEASARALEETLETLSQRLLALSKQSAPDPVHLGHIADAISKTAQALGNVRALH